MKPKSLVFMNIHTQNLFNTEGYCHKIIKQKLRILTMNCVVVEIWHPMNMGKIHKKEPQRINQF